MFNRIRYAAHVLSAPAARTPTHETPDIAFEDVKPQEVTRAGKAIAKLIEIVLFSCIVGYFSATVFAHVFAQKHANVGIAASITSVCTLVINHFYDRLSGRIFSHLKISEKISPYFGRRLAKSYRILRG